MTLPQDQHAIATSRIPARLQQLREAMLRQGLDACLIPSADPHLSEYLPGRWQGREHFCGFTGSVGTLIVTANFAGLWVDSRYWAQAETELANSGVQLMKIPSAAATLHINWLAEHLQSGQVLAVDGTVLGLSAARALLAELTPKGVKLDTSQDILEQVWSERPALPLAPVYEHAAPFAVISRADKLAAIRQQMQAKNAHFHFVSTVDDIAWIFNLRGSDVRFNPVFLAHALIGLDSVTLFVAPSKLNADLTTALKKDGIHISAYENAASALSALPASATLLIDPRRITYGFRQALAPQASVIEAINPSVLAKSRKTAEEAQFVRSAMEQDGAALCEFFSWLENNLGKQRITELDIDEQITAARARQPHFISASFATIAGFNPNGAMPHYRARVTLCHRR
jgi:Xaa-Pro aminopeptidase